MFELFGNVKLTKPTLTHVNILRAQEKDRTVTQKWMLTIIPLVPLLYFSAIRWMDGAQNTNVVELAIALFSAVFLFAVIEHMVTRTWKRSLYYEENGVSVEPVNENIIILKIQDFDGYVLRWDGTQFQDGKGQKLKLGKLIQFQIKGFQPEQVPWCPTEKGLKFLKKNQTDWKLRGAPI